jgi:hypothetical protein
MMRNVEAKIVLLVSDEEDILVSNKEGILAWTSTSKDI